MKTNSIFAFAFLFILLVLINNGLVGCQTSPQVAFESIEMGAKKGEVLSTLGGPVRSYRKDGYERWVYRMQSKSGAWMIKELWLKDGVVVQKVVPEQSAQPQESDYEEL